MAEEMKTTPVPEEQKPEPPAPEVPGSPPAPEQAVIPGMEGPAPPENKVIDLSSVRAGAGQEQQAAPEGGQEWEKPQEEEKKPRRGRRPKAKEAPAQGDKPKRKGRPPKAEKQAPGGGGAGKSAKTPKQEQAPRQGKTVVENKGMGFIIETIQPGVFTAEDANKAAASGGATHGFFYRKTDFLFSAAQEYTVLNDNEVFRHRNINDVNFVRDTLDFFTDGNYTQADVNRMQDQITAVVRELAQQIKDGGSPDLSKVKTTLTVGGAEVSISQLLDMQETGRGLSESFGGMTSGSLTAHNIEAFAEMGMSKALGNYYGSDKGAIGQMFSKSIDRLYEKGVAEVQRANTWAQTVSYGAKTSSNQQAVKTELGIADMFSKMDTGSKSGLIHSYSSTLAQARALVQQYCNQYNFPTSHVGLAGATAGIDKFFQAWINKL